MFQKKDQNSSPITTGVSYTILHTGVEVKRLSQYILTKMQKFTNIFNISFGKFRPQKKHCYKIDV